MDANRKAAGRFHAFVAYNSLDRAGVEWICEQLTERGVRLWVDYQQNMAGRPLVDVISTGMRASDIAIAIFGVEGLGRWERLELGALTGLYAQNRIGKLIPLLLPGATEPEDGLVPGLSWLKFHEGVDDTDVLDQLQHAITNEDPRARWDAFEIHLHAPAIGEGCFVSDELRSAGARHASIVRAVNQAGLDVLEGPEPAAPNLYTYVTETIRKARIVIVDCATQSCNGVPAPEVLYEWGAADALGKPVIVLDCGHSKLPLVASARTRLAYPEDATGRELELTTAIRGVNESLDYPYLTESNRDDVFAHRVRFMCMRPAFWRRLRTIILFGTTVHDRLRELAQHVHKLDRDIQRACKDYDDISQTNNDELHRRNWAAFEKTFSEDYCSVFESVQEWSKCLEEAEQHSVEAAFEFLVAHLRQPLRDMAGTSFAHYWQVVAATENYTAHHRGLVDHIARHRAGRSEALRHSRSLCVGLSDEVKQIDLHVSRMTATLMGLIAREQRGIGGRSHVYRANGEAASPAN
jgi:hypothetical protein